jgi:pimeloyl-ACP methyl ester carboxylesterase
MHNLIDRLFEPLSHALLPLSDGLFRRIMLGGGAAEAITPLDSLRLHYYYSDPAQLPPRRFMRRRPAGRLPIILIHGLGDRAQTWGVVARLLARRHPVYAIDLPGYGLSSLPPDHHFLSIAEMCEIVRVFITQVAGGRAVIAGNSLGGWIAARLAQTNPEIVAGIALINPGGAVLTGIEDWEPFRAVVDVPDLVVARLAAAQVFGLVPTPLHYMLRHTMRRIFDQPNVRAFVAAAQDADFLHAAELQQIDRPTAILWGKRDRFLPAGSLDFFRANIPQATIRLLRGSGHLPQRERPLAVARFLDRFARQCAQ